MKTRTASLALLTLSLPLTLLAQASPIRPGNWEILTKMSMPGMTLEVPPMKATQCVTAEMIKDPQSAIPKGPAQGDCKVTDFKLADSVGTYTMTCAQPPLTASGEIHYSGTDAYSGTMKVDMAGQTMSISYDAKRIGDCQN